MYIRFSGEILDVNKSRGKHNIHDANSNYMNDNDNDYDRDYSDSTSKFYNGKVLYKQIFFVFLCVYKHMFFQL